MSSLPIQNSIEIQDVVKITTGVKDAMIEAVSYIVKNVPLLNISPEGNNTAEKIISFVVITIKLLLIFILIYTVYFIIFKGYPRVLVDIGTFKFFNKVKLDEFIKERNILINNIKFLSTQFSTCMTPYAMYQSLYGPTNLYSLVQKFEQSKAKYYQKYKYDDQYHNTFKEYFLFYNRVDKVDSKVVWNKKENVTISDYPFYELLLTYRKMNGEIEVNNTDRGGKKGKDELMFEIYQKERSKKFITKEGIIELKTTIQQLASEVKSMNMALMELPIIPYVIIPEDDLVITSILKDVSSYYNLLRENGAYTIASNKISDYSWYIIEYMMSIYNPKQYETFSKEMPAYTNADLNVIIYYLNLTREEKEVAEKRVMNTALSVEFYEYIKKRPIFAHIYFAQNVKLDKAHVYGKIMSAYKLLGDCGLSDGYSEGGDGSSFESTKMQQRLKNLQDNGRTFKALLMTVAYLNLFLNDYQKSVTQMYEKQIISDERFFIELWNPFVEDIVKNRIGNYFKRVFSSEGMGSSYSRFDKWYKQLGADLTRMIKAVFASFFTSVSIVKPQAVDTTDNAPSTQ